MINVLIVNRSRLMCSMVAAALEDEPDVHVFGSATSMDEALDLIRSNRCDVVLVNTNLPNDGALALTQALQDESSLKVLVMGLAASNEVILRYIEAGAAGYVLAEDAMDDLLKNVRAVHGGTALISAEVAALLISRVAELTRLGPAARVGTNGFTPLTPREREVLDLVSGGLSNREIAGHLVIEEGTVKNHVHRILRKLDVNRRQDAAACWALIQGRANAPFHAVDERGEGKVSWTISSFVRRS